MTVSPAGSRVADAGPSAHEHLGVELARLEAAFDCLPVAAALMDGSLRLLRATPAFTRLLGVENVAEGCELAELFTNALDDLSASMEKVRSGVKHVQRTPVALATGPRVLDVSFTPLGDHVVSGGYVIVLSDVTDLELALVQEARAREKRLAAVGQLAAGVMHDVNNALNPIMAAAYLLEVHADDANAVRDYARRIAMAAETGAATAARVGRFIRQEPLQGSREELVDLDALADEVVAMTRPMWAERVEGGRIQLARETSGDARVRGIAGEVREALLNLVQNAIDAMPNGGTLGIATGTNGDSAWIDVRDSGIGMSAEVRERAFEPFFTTKGRKGSGLGLAEVYGIMRRHRGAAEIDSPPGAGVRVRLTFPRAATPVCLEILEVEHRRPRRVLIVEDHEDGREFMRALLESDGHMVTAVDSIGGAVEQLERLAGGYDVLLADIGLPDGSGWDLVRDSRVRWPELRIGVVTGWEPTSEPSISVDFTLRKPVPAQELLQLVAV